MVDYSSLIDFALIMQIFVLINPLSSLPVLMEAYKKKLNEPKIALSAVSIAFIIAVIMAFIGPPLLNVFGITLDSFRIAGGIVLLMLGIHTVLPKEESKRDVKKVDALVSIIATPLLTGPATISFVTVKASEIGRLPLVFNLVAAFLLVGIVFFVFSVAIAKINMKAVSITSRVLGLFLTAVAIQMIFKGLSNLALTLPWFVK